MKEADLSLRLGPDGWALDARAGARRDAAGHGPRLLTSGMSASPTVSPAEVLCWDAFLPVPARDAMFDHICRSAATYKPSRTHADELADRDDLAQHADAAHRKSLVHVDDPWIREHIVPALATPFLSARRHFAMERVPFGRTEIQVTASGDGDYYAMHCDDTGAGYYERMLTFVYYLHRHPRPFDGGALHVFDSAMKDGAYGPAATHVAVEPLDNRLVIFPSDRFHAVNRVDGATARFEERRITVNGWFRAAAGFLPPLPA